MPSRRKIEAAPNRRTVSERSYDAALNSAAQAVVTLSLDRKITGWNPGAEKLYGFSAAEAIGQPVTIIVPMDRRRERAPLPRPCASGEVWGEARAPLRPGRGSPTPREASSRTTSAERVGRACR